MVSSLTFYNLEMCICPNRSILHVAFPVLLITIVTEKYVLIRLQEMVRCLEVNVRAILPSHGMGKVHIS
jgi:CRISPR/Cas system CMR subunit Cmr4 (Cas7 group RAMP superfamily)